MSSSATAVRPAYTRLRDFAALVSRDIPIVSDARARIYLASFALLFFELLCIRWIPSYVRYLSYFNNFILMASFLGMGLGILSARRQRFRFPPFPVLVLLLVVGVTANRF